MGTWASAGVQEMLLVGIYSFNTDASVYCPKTNSKSTTKQHRFSRWVLVLNEARTRLASQHRHDYDVEGLWAEATAMRTLPAAHFTLVISAAEPSRADPVLQPRDLHSACPPSVDSSV